MTATTKVPTVDAQSFCYWLQGFAELTDKPPTAEQWKSIREHLQLTFIKVTPPVVVPQESFPGMPGFPGIFQC